MFFSFSFLIFHSNEKREKKREKREKGKSIEGEKNFSFIVIIFSSFQIKK